MLAKEKDTVASAKIDAAYAEIDKLAAEKLGLAERVVELITRARARLDHDVSRVLVLQGEPPDVLSGYSSLGGGSFTLGGRNPVGQINESLRNAFAGAVVGLGPGDVLPLSPVAQATAAADTHKNKSDVFYYYYYYFIRSLMTLPVGRRLGLTVSNSSMKLPSPAPYAPSQRSRLSQAHSRNSPARGRRGASLFGMDEVDGEGEEDYDENGDNGDDGEDKEIYCFCQKLSYGEVSGIIAFCKVKVVE